MPKSLYPDRPAPLLPKTLVTPQLLDAIALIESDFGKVMRSHDGKSNGWHQMTDGAWQEVSEWRKTRGYARMPYSSAYDYRASTLYCGQWLNLVEGRFRQFLHREPTLPELLAAYNGGFWKLKSLAYSTKPFKRYIDAVIKNTKTPPPPQ